MQSVRSVMGKAASNGLLDTDVTPRNVSQYPPLRDIKYVTETILSTLIGS